MNLRNQQPQTLAPDDKRITRKEARDLLHALDRPEFSGLMDGYINEISDPNNIKETNQFLKQSEENKDLPSNVKLAKPKPGFCIKSIKYKIKTPSNRQKVFINICSYHEVPEPKSNENNMWSLPHLLNKGRHDQDKHKKICTTFDVVFNEKAIELANKNQAFKKFVCDTAINGINDQLLSSEGEKISSDFVVKKFNYKGLEISYINIHSLNKGEMDDRKEPTEYHKTQIQKEVEKMKKDNEDKEKKNNNKDDDEIDVYDQPDIDTTDKVNDVITQQKIIDKDSKIPIYKIKYSDNFELKNYFYQPDGINESKPEYTKIIISINTPLMNSVGDANLEVDVKELKFSYKDIYELNIKLPVEVKKESVTAKYDKSKKILNVTAEILRKELPKIPIKEDENIEIVKDDEEEEKEREEKRKEEEEKKRIEEERIKKEEEEKKRIEEEKIKKEKEEQEKKIKEIEEKLKKEKEEKEKKEKEEKEKLKKEKEKEEEILIKGKKEEIKNDLPLKEVKFKKEEDEEIKKEENNKKLIEEIPQPKDDEISTDSRLLKKNQHKDEDDQPNEKIVSNNNINTNNMNNNNNEENKTPIIFLSFASDWVYDLQ